MVLKGQWGEMEQEGDPGGSLEGEALQAERTVRAKVLGKDRAWHIRVTGRRPTWLGQSEGERGFTCDFSVCLAQRRPRRPEDEGPLDKG